VDAPNNDAEVLQQYVEAFERKGTGKQPPPSGQRRWFFMCRAETPWPATSWASEPSSSTTDGSSPSSAAPWSWSYDSDPYALDEFWS
jgi:hypothetical protein